ncbi:DUF418 domain-containing protein [Stackebrandtia soli]|uniref:DUF418 domain-containing protein n=1 Tax=Stackebrandtia soli TaxID=1892856 RepID=UPI0039E8294B
MPLLTPALSPSATPTARRSLAPDLARGIMLLVIALAHARIMAVLFGGGSGESSADAVTQLLLPMFVDGRGYPMFAALFGYGLCQIHLRRREQGWEWPAIRSLVRRRGLWLFLFGLVHVALLFFGDILSVYGLVALVFAAVLRNSDKGLLRRAAGWSIAGSALYAGMLAAASATETGPVPQDPIADAMGRLITWPIFVVPMFATTVFPFLIGVWAARRHILEEPSRHLPLLRRVAFIGIPVGILGGLPRGLHDMGAWQEPGFGSLYAAEWLTTVAGYAGGLGYAALIGLLAARLNERPGRMGTALAATGERSMTSYLLQSVAWMALYPPYLLGLGAELSTAGAMAVGLAVWLTTVLIAEFMRRRGWRGPAERLLRDRTYGRRRAADKPTSTHV